MDALGNVAQQFGVYWPNLIAQVILFGIVYFVLKRFAFHRVIAMLEEEWRGLYALLTDPNGQNRYLERIRTNIKRVNSMARTLSEERTRHISEP